MKKLIAFTRTLFFVLAILCIAMTICSADGPNIIFPIICFIIGIICFGISYTLDKLLWQTGDKKSLFTH